VTNRITLPDGSGHLELPGTEDGYVAAIICRSPDGSMRWQALPPGGGADAWVAVRLEGNEVVANSWSCWCVRFDPTTGAETRRHFTK